MTLSLSVRSPIHPPPPPLDFYAGCRGTMSRLGALGGSRAGLGLLFGTAAGLGFLCILYSQRWKRAQSRGRSHSLPNSLDYAQASERGRQGKSTGHYLLMTLGPGLSLAEQVDRPVEGLSFTLLGKPYSFLCRESARRLCSFHF